MAGNKFNRYLWLINLLRTQGPIPFKDISEKWRHSIYNDEPGKALPLKTFHNHCGVIAEIFGVDVECEKGGNYGYYIPDVAESERWKMDLLDQLLLSVTARENPSLNDRILILNKNDKLPMAVLDAVKNHSIISFERPKENYKPFLSCIRDGERMTDLQWRQKYWNRFENYCPLGIFQVALEWWMVGVFVNPDGAASGRISPFPLGFLYTQHIEVSNREVNEYPDNFSLPDYLNKFQEKHKEGFIKEDSFSDGRRKLYEALRLNAMMCNGRGTPK